MQLDEPTLANCEYAQDAREFRRRTSEQLSEIQALQQLLDAKTAELAASQADNSKLQGVAAGQARLIRDLKPK